MTKKVSLIIITLQLIKEIWYKFKNKVYTLFIITLLASSLEVLSLYVLLKFLSILIPQEINIYSDALIFGVKLSTSSLAIYLLLISLLSAFIRSYSFYFNTKTASEIGAYLGSKGYANSLKRSYSHHISSDLNSIITKLSFTGNFIGGFLLPLFQSISSGFLAIFVITGLFILTGKIAIILLLITGLFYFLVTKITKDEIKRSSQQIPIYAKQELKLIKDSFLSIKDIKLDNNHEFFIKIFKKINKSHRSAEAISFTLASIPRFWVESFSIGVISISTLLLVNNLGSTRAIPIIAVIALGAQRLMPSLQTLYGSFATIRSNKYSAEAILSLQNNKNIDFQISNSFKKKFKNISFDSLYFNYIDKNNIIRNLSFKIEAGEKIGICGLSGSGKSTILDIIMGLLEPTKGFISIDGKVTSKKLKSNNRNPLSNLSSHVPQDCFLIDGTIIENIAFGIPKDQINLNLVRKSAKVAEIHDFIESLPFKYESLVGENGKALSGGQKQRLAIARAIYKRKPMLILDEATSSLDNITENNIIKNVFKQFPKVSIVVVAHRLTSLKTCDKIFVISKGSISEIGKYDELVKKGGLFYKMLKASSLEIY